MKLLIGKLLPDGTIRYISLGDGRELRRIAEILRVFYSRERRLDALLELGNLVSLGPTPYGDNTHEDDCLHCYAEARDNHYATALHNSRIADGKEFFAQLSDCVFLWERGRWYVYIKNCRKRITSEYIYIPKTGMAIGTRKIYHFDSEGKFSTARNDFTYWKQMLEYAQANNETFYVFGKEKLLTVVNPPQNHNSHE